MLVWILPVLVSVVTAACSPQRMRQAEDAVRTADSLRAAGQYYSDSGALADAVRTLRPLRLFHRNTYAHACYHYGRLLIDLNHPMSAVEQLLQAERYAGKDYALQGRTQTNIAYACQLEERWLLAYDIYQQAGNNFLLSGDTIAYYASLYSMAMLSAYSKRCDSTFVLVDSIRSYCPDPMIRMRAYAPLMQFYMCTDQFESALQCADSLLSNNICVPLAWLVKAQAYHYLNQKDSACWYAEKVVATDSILLNRRNAYYILTNDDVNANKELIKQRAAIRADIQHEMQHRQAELTQAVDYYLQQKQVFKRRKITLFIGSFVGITLLFAGLLLYLSRRKHKKDIINLHKKNKSLQQTNQDLHQTNQNLLTEQAEQHRIILSDVEHTCQTLLANPDWMEVMQWTDYQSLRRNINSRFYRLEEHLQASGIKKEQEIRLCVLVLLNLSHKKIAAILGCSPLSIGRNKENTAQKLGVHGGDLRVRLLELIGAKSSR